MNATCERLNGTLRRQLLDRALNLGEAHLYANLAEYRHDYSAARPHQGIDQRIPDAFQGTTADLDSDRIRRKLRPERPDKRIPASRLTSGMMQVSDQSPISERHKIRPPT